MFRTIDNTKIFDISICVDNGVNPKGPPFGLQHAILRGYLIAAD